MKMEPVVIMDTKRMFAAYNWIGKRYAIIVADNKKKAREALRGWEKYFTVLRPYRYRDGDFGT